MKKREEILKYILKPHFKKHGFKIAGNHFKKSEKGFTKIINPQFSQWNGPTNVSFTFNIGFFFPTTMIFENKEIPKSISVHDCQINERFGTFFYNHDYWISSESEIQQQIEKITNWFEKFDSLDSLFILEETKNAFTTYRLNYDIAISKLEKSFSEGLLILEKEYDLLENKSTFWADSLKTALEKIKQQN